jgi:hypothetical protein
MIERLDINDAKEWPRWTSAGYAKDQLALELGKPAEYRQHQPTMRCGRIRPGIALKASAGLGNGVEDIQQVGRRSRQPIETRHHQNVAGLAYNSRGTALDRRH